MPKYNNPTERFQGGEYLKIPPNSIDYTSIYQYNTDGQSFSIVDSEPYYNPIKFKQLIKFDGENQYEIDLPYQLIDGDKHLVMYTQCDNMSYDSIEIFFNSIDNLPSLPLTNTEFSMINFNRIKRLIIKTKAECVGEILVMVSDRYVPSMTSIHEPASPTRSAGSV